MKHIQKTAPPALFTQWLAQGNEDWTPTYSTLSGQEKQAVKSRLLQEQGYICCYCEKNISDCDSHIEHFLPQSKHPTCELNYLNLLCSCGHSGGYSHCGYKKGNWFEPALMISPQDPNCEKRFEFRHNGRIRPANTTDLAAQETINRLGLDNSSLNDHRRKVIEPFLDGSLTPQEVVRFRSDYLQISNNKYNPFWTTIQYLFG